MRTIYVVTNEVTGQQYVGQTSMSLRKRFAAHCDRAMYGKWLGAIHCAIRLHGRDKFSIAELERCADADSSDAEGRWIKRLGTQYPSGYNIRDPHGPHADTTKAKMCGRIVSEKTRRTLSAVARNRVPTEAQLEALRRGRNKPRPGTMVGTKNPRAILTEDDVRDIRRRYAAGGVSQQKLADEYGVQQITISVIVRRKNWAHVT